MHLSAVRPSSRRPPTSPPMIRLEPGADSLRELRSADNAFRQVDLCLGQRRLLHRQPWRQGVRPAAELSLLERIRRFEAGARRH